MVHSWGVVPCTVPQKGIIYTLYSTYNILYMLYIYYILYMYHIKTTPVGGGDESQKHRRVGECHVLALVPPWLLGSRARAKMILVEVRGWRAHARTQT